MSITPQGRHRKANRTFAGPGVVGLLALGITAFTPSVASASTAEDIPTLALANVGKGAGTCSLVNPTRNSLGGTEFGRSCTGNGGSAEYWCADFVSWVWQNADAGGIVDADQVDGAAVSFYNYGVNHDTLHTGPLYRPQVGDAIVYDVIVPAGSEYGSFANHVGIVTAVNADGSIQTVNGDFGGASGFGEAHYAETSSVKIATIDAADEAVGSTPPSVRMTIDGYVTPVGPARPGAPSAEQMLEDLLYGVG